MTGPRTARSAEPVDVDGVDAAAVASPRLLSVCRSRRVPLTLRRRLARLAVPYSDSDYEMEIDGVPYSGRLDNYIEWLAFVTGQFYEFSYLNLIRTLKLRGCALDVGANVGNHTAALSGMFNEVLAFEPFPALFERLNSKARRLTGVRAFPLGLGDEDAEMMFTPPTGRNLGKGRVESQGSVPVRIVHGDTFLATQSVRDIGFIKVDVEGLETEVLRGLAATIAEQRPVVMYEVAYKFGGTSDGFSLFPEDYAFWAVKGQSTFPLQRQVARAWPVRQGHLSRFHTYVIACPTELGLSLA